MNKRILIKTLAMVVAATLFLATGLVVLSVSATGEEMIPEEEAAENTAETAEDTPRKETRAEKKQQKKLESTLAETEKELEKAKEELAASNDRYMRMLAEYDNYRKRTQKEKDTIYADAYSDAMKQILPIIDNLELAARQSADADAAQAFLGNLKLASIATHVADARTCCLHPASTTHRQMTDEELIAAGVGPDLVRMSCGIEATADLVADIEQALG